MVPFFIGKWALDVLPFAKQEEIVTVGIPVAVTATVTDLVWSPLLITGDPVS